MRQLAILPHSRLKQGPAYLSGVYRKQWQWIAWQGGCGATLRSSLTITPGVMLASEAKLLGVQSIPSSRTQRHRIFTFLAVVTGKVQRSSYEMFGKHKVSLGDLGQVPLRAFSKSTYSFIPLNMLGVFTVNLNLPVMKVALFFHFKQHHNKLCVCVRVCIVHMCN